MYRLTVYSTGSRLFENSSGCVTCCMFLFFCTFRNCPMLQKQTLILRLQTLILSLGVHFMVYARCGETTFCSIYGIASYYGAVLFQVCSYVLTLDSRMHVINLISVHFSERFIVGTKLLQMHASKSENRNSF